MDIQQEDLNEIARLIQEGCTSGILDPEGRDRITWSLTIE
jgi:hypothetical protein